MKELDINSPKYRGYLGSGKWTLCVGAGISLGLVPSWLTLSREIVNAAFGTSYDQAKFSSMVNDNGWGLDSWIQAGANQYLSAGKTVEDFNTLIETILYRDLRARAKTEGIENELIIALNNPRSLQKDVVFAICTFFEKHYANTSVMNLARCLINAEKHPDRLPAAIITLNADTLLHTFIELFQRQSHFNGPPPHSHPKYIYKTILRGTTGIPRRKIPIFHCHGAIKPVRPGRKRTATDSRDKLVFLEQDYLRVATSFTTWAETIFMYQAQAQKMVFLGLSMSDPNIRRWMAVANQNTEKDMAIIAPLISPTPKHIWITTRDADPKFVNIKNSALVHLGIRPGWLDRWDNLGTGLTNLMGLT